MTTSAGSLAMMTLCLALAASAVHAGVIVVDPAGGPGAALLQAALDASQPGDILLLEAGDYSAPGAPVITGAGGRVIVADAGVTATLSGLRLEGGPAAPTVLRDLTVAPAKGNQFTFQLLETDRAWIEGCHSSGSPVEDGLFGTPGINVQTCPAAYVIRGEFQGGAGTDAHTAPDGTLVKASGGGPGLSALSIELLSVQDTVATGGAGANGMPDVPFKASGAAGASVGFGQLASFLGCSFHGGDEGADPATSSNSGPGAAVSFTDLQTRDTIFIPGQISGAGVQALPLQTAFADLTEFDAAARTLELSSTVRELQPVTITIHGQQGDVVLVWVATDFGGTSAPFKQGISAVGGVPAVALPLGSITAASGDLVTSTRLGRLPPGVDGMVLYAQLVVTIPQGQLLLGSASSVVWLSAAL